MRCVKKAVDPVFELACVGKKLEPRHGAFFENVLGSSMPVVTGIATSRDVMAESLGLTYEQLKERFSHAIAAPTPALIVREGSPEVKQRRFFGDKIDLRRLPACVHHEKDSGPYITAALCIVRDPDTGIRNVSIHRHEVRDKNHLGALLLPRHTCQIFDKLESRGHSLEIALVIGVHPALLLSSQATTRLGVDELEIAGSLLGEPLHLTPCETVGLEVPLESEIVIEGRLLAHAREDEGPFGEYPKTYGPRGKRHVIEVSAVMHRAEPIYHTIIPASMEHLLLGGVSREAGMLQLIRQATPNVTDVRLTPAGGCRYHAVIQLDQKHAGEAKNAIFAALASSTEVKHVIAVNTDINIDDMQDVEWALANRVQGGRDIFVVTGAMGNKLDPSSCDGQSDKVGIDATIPMDQDPQRFAKMCIPGFDGIRLEDYLTSFAKENI